MTPPHLLSRHLLVCISTITVLMMSCDSDPQTTADDGCRLNSDCPLNEVCVESVCVPDIDPCEEEDCPCVSNGDCAPGQSCDVETGQCFELECVSDTGCALGEVCQSGRCVTDVEADRDRDGVPDAEDSCPQVANADQDDFDGDGAGDLCDNDDDNDGRADVLDNCPLADNPIQGDADEDGQGNACDDDTPAIDITGTLDFSDAPNADTAQAQIFITGRAQPVGIDDTGRFVIDDALNEPGRLILRVVWPGFEALVREINMPDATPVVTIPDLRMTPVQQGPSSVSLRGRVQLEGLGSFEDVVVRAEIEGVLAQTTLSDDEGRFVMSLAPVTHTLRFSKTGFEPLEVTALFNTQGPQEGSFTIDEVPIEEAELTLSAVPVATLEGTLSSALNPQDWPSRALVTLVSQDQSLTRIAPVLNRQQGQDNVGAFQLTGLPVGDYTLFVAARGHLPVQIDIAADDLQDLEETLPTIELEREATAALMRGRVRLLDVDAEADQSNVIVRAAIADQTVATAVTDDQGNFVFSSSRENHTLTFSKTGYLSIDAQVAWNTQTERFERGDTPLEDPEAAFELAPIATFAVRGSLNSTLEAIDDWPSRAFVSLISADERVRRIEPALSDGRFVVEALQPGIYTLSVSARGHQPVQGVDVVIEAANVDVGTIALLPEALGEDAALMRGVVRLSDRGDEGPHGGVTVRGRVGGDLVFTTTTDDSGTFVTTASREAHTLTFSKEGYQPSGERDVTWVDADEGGFEFEGEALATRPFALEPNLSASLSGVLSSPLTIEDWPQRALVTVIGDGIQRAATVVNDEGRGRFEISGLRPGEVTLVAQVLGHLPRVQVVTVAPPSLSLGDLALVPERVTFTSEVLGPDDAPLAGVVVQVRRGQLQAASTLTDAEGRFGVALTPEQHTLTLSKPGFLPRPNVTLNWNGVEFEVDSPVEGEPPFTIAPLPTATLTGLVQSAQGARNDWPNIAFAALTNAQSRQVVGVVNADDGQGQFQWANIAPGEYTLSVVAQGHTPLTQTILLSAGDNTLSDVLGMDVVTLAFEPEDDGTFLRGRVLLEGAGNGGHAGIAVRAQVQGNLVATTLTDANGDFFFEATPQDHSLSFSSAGYIAQRGVSIRWDEGENRFEIDGDPLSEVNAGVLQRTTGQVQVHVTVEPAWIPANQRGVTVQLVGSSQTRSAVTNGEAVTFGDLPSGEYIVFTERAGFSFAQQVVVLDEGAQNPQVDLTTRLADLRTANLDLGGQTVSDADLRQIPSVTGANLTGVNIVGAQPGLGPQLCNMNLDGVSLVAANLNGANLSGSSLLGARLDNASLSNVVARSADLGGASFFGANIANADFKSGAYRCNREDFAGGQTQLDGANFNSAQLSGAVFVPVNSPVPESPCDAGIPNAPDTAGAQWNQADLSNAVMVGLDLRRSTFTATILNNADLRGACLQRATLARTAMSDARLAQANLDEASFLGALLLRANLDDATLSSASFSDVNLTDASLEGIDAVGLSLSGGVLSNTSFQGSDLSSSNWVGVLLTGVDLSGAALDEADMRNTQFIDVALTNTSLVSADLRNASMTQLDLRTTNLRDTQLNGADLSRSDLTGTALVGARLLGARFLLARYNSQTQWPADFEFRTIDAIGPETQMPNFLFPNDLDLAGTELTGADLTGARLVQADLQNADLQGAQLVQANLTGATLMGADVGGGDLRYVEFSGADLGDVALDGVNLLGATGSALIQCPAALPPSWQCADQEPDGLSLLAPFIEFVDVPAGSFQMGSPQNEPFRRGTDETLHPVTLTRSFQMQTTEVTQAQWRELMDTDPSAYPQCGDACPVDQVTWWDALAFANAMSRREGLPECFTLQGCQTNSGRLQCQGFTLNSPVQDNIYACEGYRLPTEAEWEYATRAGTQTAFHTGDLLVDSRTSCDRVDDNYDRAGWYFCNALVDFEGARYCSRACPTCELLCRGPRPVGLKEANAFGLYDASGNMAEWNLDIFTSGYQVLPETDPLNFDVLGNSSNGLFDGLICDDFGCFGGGPSSMVARGGSYLQNVSDGRLAARGSGNHQSFSDRIGFRLVRTLP